jgi:hypothetical protein
MPSKLRIIAIGIIGIVSDEQLDLRFGKPRVHSDIIFVRFLAIGRSRNSPGWPASAVMSRRGYSTHVRRMGANEGLPERGQPGQPARAWPPGQVRLRSPVTVATPSSRRLTSTSAQVAVLSRATKGIAAQHDKLGEGCPKSLRSSLAASASRPGIPRIYPDMRGSRVIVPSCPLVRPAADQATTSDTAGSSQQPPVPSWASAGREEGKRRCAMASQLDRGVGWCAG